MAKKRDKKLYIVDHANKSADRQTMNPNRVLAKRGRFRRALLPQKPAQGDKPDDEG